MENAELFEKYEKTKSIEDRNAIVEKYLYLVDVLIRKYLGKGAEYEDLYQVAALALVKATERFAVDKGNEFTTFATPTILGEIKKHFRDTQWEVKVPRKLKEQSVAVKKAIETLQAAGIVNPSVEELCEKTNLNKEEVLEAIEGSKAFNTYSLNTMNDQEEEKTLEKYMKFEEKGYEAIEIDEVISNVRAKLDKKHSYIFRERFVFNRGQKEIASRMGVSPMTVSRAEKYIVSKFKEEISK